MECPKCGQDLKPIEIDGVEVDRCVGCEGIWFDKAELGELIRRDTDRVGPILEGEDEDDADYRHGRCPRDEKPLFRVKSRRDRRVTIDVCQTCQGLWLDAGEFARLREADPRFKLGDFL